MDQESYIKSYVTNGIGKQVPGNLFQPEGHAQLQVTTLHHIRDSYMIIIIN